MRTPNTLMSMIVYFIVRPFDDAAEKAELILNNTLARMKRQDKGPTTESEKAYLVTLKSKLGELFKLVSYQVMGTWIYCWLYYIGG
jgi:hypothetical protein